MAARADASARRRDPRGNPARRAATAAPATPRCTPWARCCGTAAPEQKAQVSAADRQRRIAAAGVRRHRADQRHRHVLAARPSRERDGDHYVVNGQKIWTSRAEHSDLMLLLARTTPKEQAKKRTDGLSVFLVDMREAQDRRADHPADPHHDEPRHHRGVLRQLRGAGRQPDRRGRQGLSLHPLRHECRAHPDRRRMHRRRQMVHRQGHRLCQGARRVRPADRPEPGHPVSDRQGLCRTCAPPN